jgi:hypothetical protein
MTQRRLKVLKRRGTDPDTPSGIAVGGFDGSDVPIKQGDVDIAAVDCLDSNSRVPPGGFTEHPSAHKGGALGSPGRAEGSSVAVPQRKGDHSARFRGCRRGL